MNCRFFLSKKTKTTWIFVISYKMNWPICFYRTEILFFQFSDNNITAIFNLFEIRVG